MIKVGNKLYSFVALLFVFLSILGYQLFTTLLLPLSSDVAGASHLVTYPYRVLLFVLALFLIVTSPISKKSKQNRGAVTVYIVFMLVYLIRILIDIFGKHVYIQSGFQTVIVQYVFVSIIPSIWAMTRCAIYIDYERLLHWMMVGGCILLGVTALTQNTLISAEYNEMVRGQGNIALNTISFGHTCVSLFIIFFSWMVCHKTQNWRWNAFLILMMSLSFILMLRAASRGPLVTMVAVFLVYMFSRMKNKVLGFFIAITIILVIWINMSTILELLGRISPMMEQRMAAAMYEDDSSGRNILYKQAVDIFLQNPVFGKQFILNSGIYSHNSILDVLIGLGLIGALVWIYLLYEDLKIAYWHISQRTSLMVIGMLSLQFIMKGFLSGAIYIDNCLAICMMIVLSISKQEYPKRIKG
jgi:hypothetical protein